MAVRVIPNLIHLWKSQRWNRRRSERSQLRLLSALVRRAAHDVPLYREKFAGRVGRSLDSFDSFHQLPIVSKGDIKANFPDRTMSDKVRGRRLYPVATSGQSDRVMLFHDEHKRDWDRAADLIVALQCDRFRPGSRRALIPADACYERCGADEHGRTRSLASEFGQLIRHPRQSKKLLKQIPSLVMRDYFWREKLFQAFGVNGTAITPQQLDAYVAELRAWNPKSLSAIPMCLYVLASYVNGQGEQPIAEIMRPSGGKLTRQMIGQIEASLGGTVRENYGTAELGTIACDCAHARRQHLFSELFHVEFIRAGRHVAPGELGEIIITDLRNHAAPLIRYAVGDVGRYYDGPCPCGYQGRLFTVQGRLDETFVTPDGRAVAGDEVTDCLLAHPAIRYARVTQQVPDRFLVEAVRADLSDAGAGLEKLGEGLSALLGHRVMVRSRFVKRIAPEPSGKYRLVFSSTYHDFHNKVSNDHRNSIQTDSAGPRAVSPGFPDAGAHGQRQAAHVS